MCKLICLPIGVAIIFGVTFANSEAHKLRKRHIIGVNQRMMTFGKFIYSTRIDKSSLIVNTSFDNGYLQIARVR